MKIIDFFPSAFLLDSVLEIFSDVLRSHLLVSREPNPRALWLTLHTCTYGTGLAKNNNLLFKSLPELDVKAQETSLRRSTNHTDIIIFPHLSARPFGVPSQHTNSGSIPPQSLDHSLHL